MSAFTPQTAKDDENVTEAQNVDTSLLKTIFYDCDKNRDNILDKDDIKVAAITLFGYKFTKWEVSDLLQKHSRSGTGLTLQEFTAAFGPKLAAVDEDEEIRQTFLAFDKNCQGFITLQDTKDHFKRLAPNIPEYKIEEAFRQLDRDSDSRLSYRDFTFIMKYSLS